MKQSNISKMWIAAIAFSLMSCGDDSVDPVSEQDQQMLDEAAAKLDEQMPEARAERINNEQEQ